jgi:protein O-mannosyl-transferase
MIMATPSTYRRRRPAGGRHAPQQADAVWRPHWHALVAAAALVAMVFAAYWPALAAGFIWDDDSYVTGNLTLRSADGLRRIWFELGAVPQYYPLVHTTFWAEYQLWGLSPLEFHLVNVLLHAASAVLAWRLLVGLGVPGAWLAAALFAVHPVEVESVAWITERKNVLSLALALASLLAYFRFSPADEAEVAAAPRARPWAWYILALALFALALLSKTVVATLPAVILVIYWWKRGRIRMRDIVPLIPFFVISLALASVTAWMEKHHVGAAGAEWDFTLLDRALIAGRAAWFYAAKLLWPDRLAFFYSRWTIDRTDVWQYVYPLAAIFLVFALGLNAPRLGRGPLAAVLIFGGVLVPALGFFDVFPMRFSFVADHFQYHASLALFALLAAGAAAAEARLDAFGRRLASAGAMILLATLAVVTWHRAAVFRDVDLLYRDTIAKNPSGPTAYANLAVYLESVERYDEALAMARRAVLLAPDEATAHNTLGTCLLRTASRAGSPAEQLNEGIAEFNTALRLLPGYADAQVNLAMALAAAGRRDEATTRLDAAIAQYPNHAEAHYELGRLRFAEGDLRSAAEHFQRAADLRPDFARALNNLGVVWMNLGETDKAIHYFQEAVRARPEYAEASANLQKARQVQQQAAPR